MNVKTHARVSLVTVFDYCSTSKTQAAHSSLRLCEKRKSPECVKTTLLVITLLLFNATRDHRRTLIRMRQWFMNPHLYIRCWPCFKCY